MILADFIVFNANGLYCPYGDFYLDAKLPVNQSVISHAHGDHAVGGSTNVYCTAPTAAFMLLRNGKTAAKVFHHIAFNQAFVIGGVSITFISAGHILGSAQVLMVYQGIRYLYTGDYKVQPDDTCEPIEWAKADVLITETTFAHPQTQHPDAVTEIKKLNGIKTNILLGAYALGKSQRLIKLINQHCPQKKILVHHKIMPLNAIYEKFGFALGNYQMYGRKLMKQQNEFVYLVPPFTFESYFKATGVKRLFASGWKNLQTNEQDTLFISDHVDWNDILQCVEHTQPTQIWTLHGDGAHLKQHFAGTIEVKLLK
ncbi:putative mRNA 3-end processing factor [Mucilaginibacter gracilis]|uniref:Putative mRNA 3-end processing factor n=1 Tax=Mucilaginibacter gracilis TaxID=423350 RepID=A0A495J7P6_9SPHI|nr:MBL fold metallo-hydrolase [Mucilaginibacter gracilis]RKR84761.1 putative mRNA 3-end processing factor [Mucilaginibacter gracilis]